MINYYTNDSLGRPTQFPDYPDYPSVLLIITKCYTKKKNILDFNYSKIEGNKKKHKMLKNPQLN